MPLFIFLIPVVLWLSMIAGWVHNIVWTFQQTEAVNLVLGILGAVVAPIGAIHGLYLFF